MSFQSEKNFQKLSAQDYHITTKFPYYFPSTASPDQILLLPENLIFLNTG